MRQCCSCFFFFCWNYWRIIWRVSFHGTRWRRTYLWTLQITVIPQLMLMNVYQVLVILAWLQISGDGSIDSTAVVLVCQQVTSTDEHTREREFSSGLNLTAGSITVRGWLSELEANATRILVLGITTQRTVQIQIMQTVGIVPAFQHFVVYIPAFVATEFLNSARVVVLGHARGKRFLTTSSLSVVFLFNRGTIDVATRNQFTSFKLPCWHF